MPLDVSSPSQRKANSGAQPTASRFWDAYSALPRIRRRLVLTFVIPAAIFTILAALSAALITGASLRKEAAQSIESRTVAYLDAMSYIAEMQDADFLEIVMSNIINAPNISRVVLTVPGFPIIERSKSTPQSWYSSLSSYDIKVDVPAAGNAKIIEPIGHIVITANYDRANRLTIMLAASSAFFIVLSSAVLILLTLAFLRRNALDPLSQFVSVVGAPHDSPVTPEGDETEIEAFFRFCKSQVFNVLANESRLSALVSNVPGIAVRSLVGDSGQRLTWISDGVEAILGFPASRLVGPKADLKYGALFHPDDWKSHKEAVVSAIEDFEPYEFKVRMRTIGGDYKWMLARGRPLMEIEGEVVTEALLVDIDEQMKKSHALEESERRLSALISNVSGIATRARILPGRQTLTWISEGVENILGVPTSRFMGPNADLRLRDFMHPDDDAVNRPLVLKAINQFKPYSFKVRIRSANGEYKWMLGRGSAAIDQAGDLIAETWFVDIDQQVRKELWLDAVVTALDSSQDRIVIEGADRKVVYANRAAKDAALLHSRELLGQRMIEAFPWTEPAPRKLYRDIRKAIRNSGHWRNDVVFRRPDGFATTHDLRVTEIADGGLLYVATDITEIKTRDAREADLQAQLAENQKMESLGRLAGGIAHDFNNILAATRAFADLIVQDTDATTNANRFAGKILSATQRAANLVNQILTFSRAQDATRELVDVGEIMHETQSILGGRLPKNTVMRRMSLASDLYIRANAGHVTQVILNLAINGSDALEGRQGVVSLAADTLRIKPGQQPFNKGFAKSDGPDGFFYASGALKPDVEYVRFTCKDTGSGIPQAIAFKIFDPFFTTKEKSSGSGLGLAVVNAIISANDGFITVRSHVGSGTTFEVYWPAATAPAVSADPTALVGGDESAVNIKLNGTERILIVDDEIDVADALSLGLTRLGYETVPIYGSADALNLILEDPWAWDVMISDQKMPGLRGLDLIQRVKAVHPSMKAILFTGFNDQSTEEGARARGADVYVKKPASASVIAAHIRQLMAAKVSAAA